MMPVPRFHNYMIGINIPCSIGKQDSCCNTFQPIHTLGDTEENLPPFKRLTMKHLSYFNSGSLQGSSLQKPF